MTIGIVKETSLLLGSVFCETIIFSKYILYRNVKTDETITLETLMAVFDEVHVISSIQDH